jgi:hypothetical protein
MIEWVKNRVAELVASAVVVSVFFGWLAVHDYRVKVKQTAKIEKATSNAANLGSGAARKSQSDGVRGQRDPTTRDD